jgi:hypothetical protein
MAAFVVFPTCLQALLFHVAIQGAARVHCFTSLHFSTFVEGYLGGLKEPIYIPFEHRG